MTPQQAMHEVCTLDESEAVLVTDLDVDRRAQKSRRVSLNNRCRILPQEALVVERVAEQIRNALRRADLAAIRHLFPGHARPYSGLHRGESPEGLGILETEPQAAKSAH